MQNVEILVNTANNLIRSANVDFEGLQRANSVSRSKIEKSLRGVLEELEKVVLGVQTAVAGLPIHERPRYAKVLNTLRSEFSRLSGYPKQTYSKNAVELRSLSERDYSSMTENDLKRQQIEMKKKHELDLDALIEVADKTKSTTIEMGNELSLHNDLLDRTQANVDRTNQKLEAVNRRLERFMHTVDRCQSSCLLLIIIILILLILATLVML